MGLRSNLKGSRTEPCRSARQVEHLDIHQDDATRIFGPASRELDLKSGTLSHHPRGQGRALDVNAQDGMFFPVAARLVWGTEGIRWNILWDFPAELLPLQ